MSQLISIVLVEVNTFDGILEGGVTRDCSANVMSRDEFDAGDLCL